jgi:Tol biopolymer transport system component
MRYWKTIYVVLGLVLVATPAFSADAFTAQGQVTVTLTPLSVGVAESGVLEGQIACPSGGCASFAIVLNFDRDAIHIDSAAVGPFLGSQVAVNLNRVDNVLGVVWLAATATAPPPAGSNVLFTLSVSGLIPGSAAIDVTSLDVRDITGAGLASSGQGTTVAVNETGKIAFFSPPADGWEVAFVSEREGNPEIYKMFADGSNAQRLTDNPAPDGGPKWSPDGSRIAFYSERDGNREIYLMNADGSNVQRLTDNPASDAFPDWSPDGSRIVFVTDRDGDPELYVMDANGSNVQRLANSPGADTYPAWAPYGSEIAFSSQRGGSAELYLMNADGSNVRQLTNLFGANGWYPAWPPNGSLIALTVERDGSADIYTMDRKGQNVLRLTQKSGPLTSSAWSPDSGWLAFAGNPDGNLDLLVMDAKGQYLFRLTDDPAADYGPDWHSLAAAVPCAIRTDREDVELRVGPGTNRGVFGYLPPNQDFSVIGQATDPGGAVWFELQKDQIPGHEVVNSLWVAVADVQASGDCGSVQTAEPPPLIVPTTPQKPPGQWEGCGSCDTCGHPGECVTSPTGECLWDPATCLPSQDGGEPGCYGLTRQAVGPGIVSALTPPNCASRSYQPGTQVIVQGTPTAVTHQGIFVGWGGTCPRSSDTANPTTVTMNSNCTIIGYFR